MKKNVNLSTIVVFSKDFGVSSILSLKPFVTKEMDGPYLNSIAIQLFFCNLVNSKTIVHGFGKRISVRGHFFLGGRIPPLVWILQRNEKRQSI
jgi:hypothetical protein